MANIKLSVSEAEGTKEVEVKRSGFLLEHTCVGL